MTAIDTNGVQYPGIDYSLGRANRDGATGIHYGVIPVADVSEAWCGDCEDIWDDPHCPVCGNTLQDKDGFWIGDCGKEHGDDWSAESVYPESPLGYKYDDGQYKAFQDGDAPDIFITKSPFYTFAAYCSPCAPGAGHLRSIRTPDSGIMTYCFGHDWFEGGKAPYPVYSVETHVLVEPK